MRTRLADVPEASIQPPRSRLDAALVERGMTETRSKAKAVIMAGDVLVNGEIQTQAGKLLAPLDTLSFRQKPRFVSRGGDKLDHALERFEIDVSGQVCVDLGASTGGFTDCLLQRDAARVYAVDVGYGQLDSSLRDHQRVVVMERVNARYIDTLPEPAALVVIDVSFISLKLMFPVAKVVLRAGGTCVPLIKPQFEAGRKDVGKGGVVKDPATHRRVLEETLNAAQATGFAVLGLTKSPLVGPAGNIEFLAYLRLDSEQTEHVGGLISAALESPE